MNTKLIKTWTFQERDRRSILLQTPGIRVNTENEAKPCLQLKATGCVYPTSTDIYARLSQTKPNALVKWLMFDVDWTTAESDFAEFNLELTPVSGTTYAVSSNSRFSPRIGDRVYQGDIEAVITGIPLKGRITASSALAGGRALMVRSACFVRIRLVSEAGVAHIWDISTSAWRPATAGEWNNPYVVSAHIAALDIDTFGKAIRFDVNLQTTDVRFTPIVRCVDLAGEFDIEFVEDLIYDSLVPLLETIEVEHLLAVSLAEDTDEINLGSSDFDLGGKFNFTGAVSAFNITTDPKRLVNLVAGYTPGAARKGSGNDPGIVTLSAEQPAGNVIEIEMSYFPEIAAFTNQDFYEVDRVPCLVFESIEAKRTIVGENAGGREAVIKDKINLSGLQVESPEQFDLVFEFAVFTGSQSDQHRFGEALHRLFNKAGFVSSWGLDEPYPITVKEIFSARNVANVSNVNTHVGSFVIHNVLSFCKEPKAVVLIGQLVNRLTTNQTLTNP